MPDATLLERLGEFTADLDFSQLPSQVVSKANDAFFDLIGCYYGALRIDGNPELLNRVSRFSAATDVTLWGTGRKTGYAEAAMAHGCLGYHLEFDDGVSLGGHWGSASIPAVFSMVEHVNGNGRQLILGIVCAYEVGTRISRLYAARMLEKKIHFPCAMGAFAAAAGVGKVLGVQGSVVAGGLANACLTPVGPYSTAVSGATVKDFYSGWPGFLGIRMMDFATMGLCGDTNTFEAENGLGVIFGGEPLSEERTEAALADLGRHFSLMESYFKPYPCCRWLHAPASLLETALSRHPGQIVREVVVRGPAFLKLYDTRNPFEQKTKAQYSIPYTLGALLVSGKLGPKEFELPFRTSEIVREASQKIRIAIDAEKDSAFPKKFSVSMDIIFVDGEVESLEGGLPWGPESPATKEELIAKFRFLTEGVLTASDIKAWVALYKQGLERDGSFSQALSLLGKCSL